MKRVYKGYPKGENQHKWPGRIEVHNVGKKEEESDVPYYPRVLTPPRRHSPDGFSWGYGGSGPSDTALAILKDVMGTDPPPSLYNKFKFDVIATFGEQFEISEDDVRTWLENHDQEMTQESQSTSG